MSMTLILMLLAPDLVMDEVRLTHSEEPEKSTWLAGVEVGRHMAFMGAYRFRYHLLQQWKTVPGIFSGTHSSSCHLDCD
jgi:hypothetical protein